jgi:hypothetical protein
VRTENADACSCGPGAVSRRQSRESGRRSRTVEHHGLPHFSGQPGAIGGLQAERIGAVGHPCDRPAGQRAGSLRAPPSDLDERRGRLARAEGEHPFRDTGIGDETFDADRLLAPRQHIPSHGRLQSHARGRIVDRERALDGGPVLRQVLRDDGERVRPLVQRGDRRDVGFIPALRPARELLRAAARRGRAHDVTRQMIVAHGRAHARGARQAASRRGPQQR